MGSSSHVDDSITRKYDIKKRIGKGAYGIVWKAVDRSTNRPVAVKKIFDAFCNSTDAQRTFREIMFLQEFRNHPNIVKLHHIHRASNDKDIYLVFEFMETDLHKVIKRKHILQDLHKRFIMYQLLRATYYIHSGNVIHRDQKPSNILLDSYCRCKIADFGLARSLAADGTGAEGVSATDPALTDYVATRWYRAPEILVASKQYTKGIDMWSLGCILAEMLLGKPLFPGTSTINQVEKIMATIDPPTPADLACVCPGYGSSLFTRAPAGPRLPLSELLRGAPLEGVDLVCRLLVLNPFKRLTAEQALDHPYVARFRRQGREPALQRQVVPPLSDHVQLSVGEYRNKLYEMYQPNCTVSQPQVQAGQQAVRTHVASPTPSAGSGGSGKPAKQQDTTQGTQATLAAQQGGGDSNAHHHPQQQPGVGARRKHKQQAVGGGGVLAKAKGGGSGSSGTSGGSAALSTPPLRKPTRPPRDAREAETPEARRRQAGQPQTRHLSTEDVRSVAAAGRPRAALYPYPSAGRGGTAPSSEHLLPRRLSVSDPAVTVATSLAPAARTPQLRRPHGHQGHHQHHHSSGALQANAAGPLPARRSSCHSALDRVGDGATLASGSPSAATLRAGIGMGSNKASRTKPQRPSRVSNGSHPQLALGAALNGALAAARGSLSSLVQHGLQPAPPPHSSSTHSLGGRPSQGPGRPSQGPGLHHAYFGLKQTQRQAVHGSGHTVANIGFITASGLSELRPGYRWQR